MFVSTPINLGLQTIPGDIPNYLTALIETLRAKLRDQNFFARHRVRPQDFTRQRQLTFPLLMLFFLQQTIKSIIDVIPFFGDCSYRKDIKIVPSLQSPKRSDSVEVSENSPHALGIIHYSAQCRLCRARHNLQYRKPRAVQATCQRDSRAIVSIVPRLPAGFLPPVPFAVRPLNQGTKVYTFQARRPYKGWDPRRPRMTCALGLTPRLCG